MTPHEPFVDPVLGRVAWSDEERCWRFEIEFASGKKVRGLIDPTDEGLLENGKGLDAIHALVGWVVQNETAVRRRITDAMFDGWLSDWYDEEIDTVTTPEGFQETISLGGINIDSESSVGLTYRDGNLFGGHYIVLSMDRDGRFVFGPDMWG